jgi:hypothetical protein
LIQLFRLHLPEALEGMGGISTEGAKRRSDNTARGGIATG